MELLPSHCAQFLTMRKVLQCDDVLTHNIEELQGWDSDARHHVYSWIQIKTGTLERESLLAPVTAISQ